ncbi:MAG: DUF882 domain-containing protein [Rhodospirillales bacterium]|nr:DUF882 domain-containing protein [Rhodospirillales bacterium]MDH3792516.1 DUF882 domain-containing protein [Rhodospirillales bacterium]MDH3910360.1 DUF882 domain-containing protein [Rhodospirillales bacterium]MDH3920919.1 DUF882 domain-containing protein [Rhodospirillales bacterium]MDH3965841.1 DUF882 domain-containing protein [Rhodospirillales bacterium]
MAGDRSQRTACGKPDTRRRFLSRAAKVAAFGTVISTLAVARALAARRLIETMPPERDLALVSLHTGERLSITYARAGSYVPEALHEIDHVLRDWRTGEAVAMDRDLLDLLFALRRKVASMAPLEIISGYRSPKTNAQLSAESGGVAKRSLHMRGMAVDVRLPDRELALLHRAARELEAGGVGLYSKSGFIHVDTGRVRYWGT